ncbi:universal stress protein [Uliginosibacterium sp. 31-12]|uniref:universal stress protein n=1 Tax=Uliginosibacterium sp. 31-12 TaxID=3062781 RepID=UPI0026E294E7|nr:universal stress protein [Uliginosibacterium sp. 31-12]MDO6384713.1 universal stress protein [Uliginosibacterium sp. 31-12]
MYKHLLVPSDGSELSNRAVQSAVTLAKSLNARVTFLYIQPEFPLPLAGEGAMLVPESREEFAQSTQEQAKRILGQAEEIAAKASVAAVSRTSVSDIPYEEIISTAETEGCDLIFMASHGRRGLAGLLIGSETHKVVTHSQIPVLVYR